MKKKKLFKRCISVQLIMAMTAGLVGSSLTGIFVKPQEVEAAINVEYSKTNLEYNIIPEAITGNSKAMKDYVLKDGGLNVNDGFVKVKSDYCDGPSTLSKAKISHSTDDYNFKAYYQWDFGGLKSTRADLFNSGQLDLRFEAGIIADKHSAFTWHWSNKWDLGNVKVGLILNSSTVLGYKKSLQSWKAAEKNDDSGQYISASWDMQSNNDFGAYNWFRYEVYNTGCNCGDAGAVNTVFYVVDTVAPKVTDTYISTDKAGNNKVSAGSGFSKGETAYLTLEFDENIRFATNKAENAQLKINYKNAYNSQGDASSYIMADLVKVEGNKMVFSFVAPSSKGTYIYLDGINNSQTWTNKKYDLALLNKDGSVRAQDCGVDATSMITDLAGNSLDWSSSYKGTPKVYCDKVAPEVKKITINGSMMNNGTTNDGDKSTVFAGVGDTVDFKVYFSETIKNFNSGSVRAVLNVKDATTGENIKLGLNYSSWTSAKSVFGTDAMDGDITYFVFNKLTVTQNMIPDGEFIEIIGIEGISDVTDYSGNTLESYDLSTLAPEQQETIDNIAPGTSTTLVKNDSDIEYTAISTGDTIFTIPIVTSENSKLYDANGNLIYEIPNADKNKYISGVSEKGQFSLGISEDSFGFEYCVNTSQNITGNENWLAGNSSTSAKEHKYNLLQIGDDGLVYLHIRLSEGVNYNFNEEDGTMFVGTVNVYPIDYAGNSSKQSYTLKHKMDSVTPNISFTGNTLDIDYTGLKSTITANFNVSDTYGVKSIQYYWDDNANNKVTLTSEGLMDNSSNYTVEISTPFNELTDEGRNGSHKLTVEITDFGGNNASASKTYEYNFAKAKVNYNIADNSVDNPFVIPDIDVYNAAGGDVESTTMVVLKVGESGSTDETRKYTYYVYIMDPDETRTNLFEGITNYDTFNTDRWYCLDGNLENEGDQFNVFGVPYGGREIYDWISSCYGEVEITFVTSPEISSDAVGYGNFNFTYAQSDIATETIYLANDAEYKFELMDIKNDNGESIRDNLIYTNSDDGYANTIATLDNAIIDIKITNVTDETSDVDFGLNAWDVDGSYVELYSTADSSASLYKWTLNKAETQSLVIPEGVVNESGRYYLKAVLYDIEGNVYEYKLTEYYIVDMRTNDVYLDEYYKGYVFTYVDGDDEKNDNIILRDDTGLSDEEECKELTVALNPLPEGWSVDTNVSPYAGHTIKFYNPTISNTIGYTEIAENTTIKIYNSADKNGTENAVVLDGESYTNIEFTPVLVEEFTVESYGEEAALQLPLVAGFNKIIIEITNTNKTVTVKEVVINAETKACEFEIKSDKTSLREIISAEYDIAVADREITFREFDTWDDDVSDSYTYDYDCKLYFYAYDTIGTVYALPYEVYDVDGVSPHNVYISTDSYYDGGMSGFRFEVIAQDNDLMSVKDLTVTFDSTYSAVLLGLTGDERTDYIAEGTQITMQVPVCLEQDENGDYIPWEEYGSGYNGIFRTLVSESDINAEGSAYSIEIWGTFKFDNEAEKDVYIDRTITVTAYDYNGNYEMCDWTFNKSNSIPRLGFGGIDENGEFSYDEDLDLDGSVVVYSEHTPLSKIASYGGTPIKYNLNDWSGFEYYYSSLPMIYSDGIYDITYYDLFGQEYTQSMIVDAYGTTDIQFEYSETEFTNKDVIVSVKTLLPGDTIETITGVANGEAVTGVIRSDDNTQSYIVMPHNGTVTVTTEMGKSHTVRVVNIDKEIEPVTVKFLYNYSEEPEFVEGSTDTVLYEAVAMIDCAEELNGINGPLEYTFKEGTAMGSTYTFEYEDVAGNVGQITATLPYNIYKEPVPEVDDDAPVFKINLHAMRNNEYKYVGSAAGREDAADMNAALYEYIAQAYALDFDITDVNAVKVIVKAKGAMEPASYNDTSDTIDGVKLVDNYVYVTKNNVEFDVYLIDALNNISAYKNVNITSIDLEAPLVTINKVAKKDENLDNYVQAEYVVESDEFIVSLDADAYTMFDDETYIDTDWATGDDLTHYYLRYYKDIYKNGETSFTYKDIYGNIGTAVIEIQGIDNVAPIVLSTRWYGTTSNGDPSNSKMVNTDVTAVMSISKAVNKVNLYYYDETKENHVGEPILDETAVYATYNGTRVSVTYTENFDSMIVAEIFASSGGKKVYKEFNAIACIDKLAPTVTITNEALADNKLTKDITFATSEDTVVMENDSMYTSAYGTEHKLTVKDCGEYTLNFVDNAGNITQYTFTVTDIDDAILELMFSKASDGSASTSNPLDLDLSLGDTVYIMTNKAANVEVDGTSTDVTAGTWNGFVLDNESGFCLVKATDLVTENVVTKNLSVKIKDMQAPRIYFDTNTICVNEDMSLDMINVLLKNGVNVTDDRDGDIASYNMSGMPLAVEEGLYIITYTATDIAGNTGSNIRTLYICSKNTPLISVNGETAIPYGTTVVNGLTINFEVFQINEPFIIKWKAGKKTTAQMKTGANLVTGNSFEVPESGFYTIYIRTQSRKEIVTYIYVEE